ncbi:MAG: hypothetical protein HY784_13580, partial [Chloroflexi bacterium]|nr:hypothetical protein [Chloroflexota bacterium]
MPALPETVTVSQPNTSVFAAPASTSQQLGNLAAGSRLQVVGVNRAGTWHAIRWNDRFAWVHGSRTQPPPVAPPDLPERVRIASSALNLRLGANPENPGEFA